MFNYLLKSLPSQYVFAGYNVRRGLTIMTTDINGRVVYDVFLFTYIDNYLSFYVLMDNGKYKSVDFKVEVPEATAEDLMSKHIARGMLINPEDYEEYDKEQIIGVFGLRSMETLMKQVDKMHGDDIKGTEIKMEAVLDIKPAYTGMEITGMINMFNRALKKDKKRITVPPIKNSESDPYKSLIGDEMDYFDFMSNKESDQIVDDLDKLDASLDGVGNLKAGKNVVLTKRMDGEEVKIDVSVTDAKEE